MAQELLAVKLGEMDQKIGKLHGRIESSEYADAKMLQEEIENLRRECRENQVEHQQNQKYNAVIINQRLFGRFYFLHFSSSSSIFWAFFASSDNSAA